MWEMLLRAWYEEMTLGIHEGGLENPSMGARLYWAFGWWYNIV